MRRDPKGAALAALSLIAALQLLCSGAEAGPVRTSSDTCAVSQLPPAAQPSCAGNGTAGTTLAEAAARAIDYAPVVRTHPLETWHLQSPDVWYSAAAMLMADTRQPPDAAYAKFMASSPQAFAMASPQTYLSTLANASLSDAARAELKNGAPYDSQNRSTARVAFTVAPYNESFFVYTYHLFYAWAGCSNQDAVLNLNGQRQQLSYSLCLPGAQAEADWQHVSMLICAGDGALKAVAFGQRGWVEVRDCEAEGQCGRDPATGRLIIYAALGTHGSYPQPSPLVVYDFLSGNFSQSVSWQGLGGMYFGDRTLAAPGRRWEPRAELLVWVPPPGAANSSSTTNSSSAGAEWMRYGGTWGHVVVQPNVTLSCIQEPAQNATVECPGQGQATTVILQLTKLLGGVNLPGEAEDPFRRTALNAAAAGAAAVGGALVNGSGLLAQPPGRGPLAREYSLTWVTGPPPPIQTKNANASVLPCPDDLPVSAVFTKDLDPQTFSASVSTLVDYIVGVALGNFLFSLVLVAILCLPALLDKRARVLRLVASKGGWTGAVEAGARGIVAQGVKAAKAGGEAVEGGLLALTAAGDGASKALGGRSAAPLDPHPAEDPPLKDEETGDAAAGAASGSSSPAAEKPAAVDEGPAPAASLAPAGSWEDAELVLEAREGYTAKWWTWLFFGGGLWAAGFGTSIYGTWVIFNSSIVSAMLHVFNQETLADTLEILFTLLLSVIAAFDVLVMFVLFFMKPPELGFFRWRVKNWLGGWRWARDHEWGLCLTCVALAVVALCTTAFFFCLGFLVTVAQVAARILCKRVMSITFMNTSVQQVCVDLPFTGGEGQVCGWQAMQVCSEVTNMDVRLTLLGSMMLLWAHIIFLVDLAGTLENHRTRQVVLQRAAAPAGGGDADDGKAPQGGSGGASMVPDYIETTE